MTRNINFEEVPKHEVSERSLSHLQAVMYKQDDIGVERYGEALQHYLNYDWEAMADEEIADFLKYRQCARERKAHVIEILKAGLRATESESKDYIQIALELLTVEGTGK
ncbi:hypothetical protein [Cytobacillus gottheilii]|uniref:Uncharacterized protein n=1 Tax=Cytobacillus gottheilii TaxID=859144 RepID=A0ABX8F958_9BACI|nr:hypothetical protein [Cytobacillus gottheilii]QVY60958.1 hypothetical protein J1899_18605 [Cytobacillus gottheilii]